MPAVSQELVTSGCLQTSVQLPACLATTRCKQLLIQGHTCAAAGGVIIRIAKRSHSCCLLGASGLPHRAWPYSVPVYVHSEKDTHDGAGAMNGATLFSPGLDISVHTYVSPPDRLHELLVMVNSTMHVVSTSPKDIICCLADVFVLVCLLGHSLLKRVATEAESGGGGCNITDSSCSLHHVGCKHSFV